MNLTLHHRNVRMNLVFACLIARQLYELENKLGVPNATVTLEIDEAPGSKLRILVELETTDSQKISEGLDTAPGTALLKLMQSLQRKVRHSSSKPAPRRLTRASSLNRPAAQHRSNSLRRVAKTNPTPFNH